MKALAYGFDGVLVDGMDPLASYQVTREAVEKAKSPGDGELRPTLIEAVQYRFGPHTTADDPSVYRDEDEVERWRSKDPIPRLEKFLRRTDRLDDEMIEMIEATVSEEVATAIEAAEVVERPGPDDMFQYVYADLPWNLRDQRAWLQTIRDQYGDDAFLED